MSDSLQVESARQDVSRHPEQERQVSLGEDPARTVHEADAVSTSPVVGTCTSSDLSRIALVGPMSPSGLDARVLEKAPRPPSTSNCTAETGSQAEELSIRQLLVRLDARLEVLTKLAVSPVVNAPATTPEAAITPDGPTPPGSKPHSTTSATQKKWQHCPPLVPYLKGATPQNPLSVLDLQDSIRVKTGYAPSLPALQNNLWKLVEEGKVNTYVRGPDGNLIPYRVRRSKFKLYVVRTDAVNRASQSASLLPNPRETSPEPEGGGPISKTQDGLALPSSPAATLDSAPDSVPEATANEVPPPKGKGLTRWLRQFGSRKVGIPTGR